MRWDGLRVVAGLGAAVQGYFAYQETHGWGAAFVAKAAPAWLGHLPPEELPPATVAAIAWAEGLAFNMGIYNLVLAIGLAWVMVAGAGQAGSLGIFLGLWLLMAAAAALSTQVYVACLAQGVLGLAVLVLSIRAARRSGETSPTRVRVA
jgi:hypothetical protein